MKILKNWFVLLMAVCVLGFSASAHAMEAPDALIKRISKEVIDTAKTNKELKKGNQKQIYAFVQNPADQ